MNQPPYAPLPRTPDLHFRRVSGLFYLDLGIAPRQEVPEPLIRRFGIFRHCERRHLRLNSFRERQGRQKEFLPLKELFHRRLFLREHA